MLYLPRNNPLYSLRFRSHVVVVGVHMFDLRIIEAWVQTASVSNPSSGAQHGSAEARGEATR